MKKNYAKDNKYIRVTTLFLSVIAVIITYIIMYKIKGEEAFYKYYYIEIIVFIGILLIGVMINTIYKGKKILDLKDLYVKILTDLYGNDISVSVSEEIVDLGNVANIDNKRKKFNFKAYISKYNCTINNFDLEYLSIDYSNPSSYTPIYSYTYAGNYIEYIYPLTRNDFVINENILKSFDNKILVEIIDNQLIISKRINDKKYLYNDVLNDLKDVAKYYDLIICNLEINNIKKENLDNNTTVKNDVLNLTSPKLDIAISAIIFLIISVSLLFIMPFNILSVVKILLCETILILGYIILSFIDIRFSYLVIFVAYMLCGLVYILI